MSAYALFLGVVYWFLSYEVAGTVLLLGFGLATGVGFAVLRWESRAGAGSTGPDRSTDRPFTDESGAIPIRSLAPLIVGFGVAVAALGLVFGIWFVIGGAIPIVAGGLDWLRSAQDELRLAERSEARDPLSSDSPSPSQNDSQAAASASRGPEPRT
jgi:hypothetical protein